MIKLKCPNCDSERVYFLDIESDVDQFMCDQCGKIFTITGAGWEQEE